MQNIIAAIFENESEGFQAMTQLRQKPVTDQAAILQMALIKCKDQDFEVLDRFESGLDTADDMLIGGLVGSLVGILGGPIGVLLMGSYGMLAGSLFDMDDAITDEAMVETVAGKLLDGEVALIALADENDEAYLDGQLGKFKTQVMRFDAAVVAQEVDEAAKVEKEMARQARVELRKSKKDEFKQGVEEKRNKISADFAALKNKFKGE